MIWNYIKLVDNNNIYTYSYSCVDEGNTKGEIEYDKKTQEIKVTKIACGGSEISAEWAAEHFMKVVIENFPNERTVRTG